MSVVRIRESPYNRAIELFLKENKKNMPKNVGSIKT